MPCVDFFNLVSIRHVLDLLELAIFGNIRQWKIFMIQLYVRFHPK